MDQSILYKSVLKFAKRISLKNSSKPKFKFLCDVLFGMIASSSLVITEIARRISTSNEEFKAAYKRLDRNLNQYSLYENYKKSGFMNFRGLTKDDIIAIDVVDIVKKYAKKMENISKVPDGSDKHKIKNGYWLLGGAAINIASEEKTPLPLELDIYSSQESGFISENTRIINLVNRAMHYSKEKLFEDRPTVVLDRGGDRSVLINHFVSNGVPFVIRLKKRHLSCDLTNQVIKIGERNLIRDSLPYEGQLKRTENTNKTKIFKFKFNYKKVYIPSRKDNQVFYLLTVWGEDYKKPMEILTNRPILDNESAGKIIISYLSRWSIEELYKFLKGKGLESVRALNFVAIKNLVIVAYLASVFLARKIKYDEGFIKTIQSYGKSLRKHSKKLYNWLNQAAVVCRDLLSKKIEEILKIQKRIIVFD